MDIQSILHTPLLTTMLPMYDNLWGSESHFARYVALLLWAGIFIWLATSLRSRQLDQKMPRKDPPNLPAAIPGGNIIRLIRGIDILAEAIMSVHLFYISLSAHGKLIFVLRAVLGLAMTPQWLSASALSSRMPFQTPSTSILS